MGFLINNDSLKHDSVLTRRLKLFYLVPLALIFFPLIAFAVGCWQMGLAVYYDVRESWTRHPGE